MRHGVLEALEAGRVVESQIEIMTVECVRKGIVRVEEGGAHAESCLVTGRDGYSLAGFKDGEVAVQGV